MSALYVFIQTILFCVILRLIFVFMKNIPISLLLAATSFLTLTAPGKAADFYRIQGTVKGANGVPAKGVLVKFANGNGSFTNGLGQYTIIVASGFSGTLTATACCIPPTRTYSSVTADQINQDFTTSAQLSSVLSPPVAGVAVSGDDGDFALTDATGRFSLDGPPGSSGSFTPEAPGIIFNPTVIPWKSGIGLPLTVSAAAGIQFPLFTAGPIFTGCYPPSFSSWFDSSTQRVYAWALLNSVAGSQFYFDWFDPSGRLWMHSAATLDFTGVGCAWAALDQASLAIANHPGTWRVVFGSTELVRGQSTFAWRVTPFLAGAIEGSMAHLAIANGWESNIQLINPSNNTSNVRLQFGDDNGAVLPLAGSGMSTNLNAHATTVVSQTGPLDQPVQTGAARFEGAGGVNGFIRFRYAPIDQDAIVPLETRAADSYFLAYDSTNGIATGVAVANLAALPATIPVIIRDDTGLTIGTGTLTIPATGHSAFVLSDRFPATVNTTGTVEFQTPQDRRISVLGIRFPPGGRFTTIPVVASTDRGGGSLAHLAVGDGWTSTVELINYSPSFAQAHLKFFDDAGNTLTLPLTFAGNSTTASSVDQTLAPHSRLVIQSNSMDGAPLQTGSAQLTASGNVSGFIRFRYGPRDQEAIVPIESRNDGSYILAFDNTGGVATGVAVANLGSAGVNINAVIRDATGATLGLGVLHVAANGHNAFVLADQFPATANASGTVEFLTPPSGPISVLGIRFPASGEFSTIPVVAP